MHNGIEKSIPELMGGHQQGHPASLSTPAGVAPNGPTTLPTAHTAPELSDLTQQRHEALRVVDAQLPVVGAIKLDQRTARLKRQRGVGVAANEEESGQQMGERERTHTGTDK